MTGAETVTMQGAFYVAVCLLVGILAGWWAALFIAVAWMLLSVTFCVGIALGMRAYEDEQDDDQGESLRSAGWKHDDH